MKRNQLKSKDVNLLVEKYNVTVHKKDTCELVEDEHKVIFVNKEALFFYYGDSVLPTLNNLQRDSSMLKQITVDMGAVKFVVNGADIMRPGIVEIEDGIEKDEFIVVVDENNKKPLAIGIALLDSASMKSSTSGKSIKNIHYVGDSLWNL
jgi:PUA-domain protein